VNQPVEAQEPSDVVELRVPARAESVALARLLVAAIAVRAQLSIDEIEDLKLAVAEACTAVIQHEHHGEFIDVTCETLQDRLSLRIRDGGRRLANHVVHPTSMDFDEARVAGLGVVLIRTLMDEVSYDVHPEHGTELRMIKRLVDQPV
jgi:serine/threonine-protein kinase RsbW